MNNPLVAFLAAYGPQASSNNLYDEFVVEASQRTRCAPLNIPQPIVEELNKMFRSDCPRSVILTGTAGDGKTYTARKLIKRLTDSGSIWGNTDKIFDIPLPGHPSRKIRFIKDLSELNEVDKDELFPSIKCALEQGGGDLYVICVNDGHLLKFFRDRSGSGGKELHDCVAGMLRNEERSGKHGQFDLINMSRQTNHTLIDDIIDAVVEHPDWEECTGCPALDHAVAPCPIRLNRDLLAKSTNDSMRARLKELIRMAAADGRHLSIRQLILLSANILLGDSKEGSTPLLSCQKAQNRASEGQYAATNPFANAFGENLNSKLRKQYGAFSIIGDFGIGYETNNFFDHSLLWGEDTLPTNSFYGRQIFEDVRKKYMRDPRNTAEEYRGCIVQQRRRIFFSVDPNSDQVTGEPRRNPWNLSLFRHGAEYIALANALDNAQVPGATIQKVLLGLNRIMTGEMTLTDRSLWCTEPSGVYQGKDIPLLIAEAGREQDRLEACVRFFKAPGASSPPIMELWPSNQSNSREELVLRPTIFEFLLRVANGSLPASFSSECRQDIERFQLRVSAAMRAAGKTKLRQIEMVNGGLTTVQISSMDDRNEGWH